MTEAEIDRLKRDAKLFEDMWKDERQASERLARQRDLWRVAYKELAENKEKYIDPQSSVLMLNIPYEQYLELLNYKAQVLGESYVSGESVEDKINA